MLYKNKEALIRNQIKDTDIVLDIGFWGQGVDINNPDWTHNVLKRYAGQVYGVDTEISDEFLAKYNSDRIYYKKINAELADFDTRFDVIFAGDLIEHLTNPGLFLDSCAKLLSDDGILIITTPNTFNLFNLSEKFTKYEPTVNRDHTFYFNIKVLKVLLSKCRWQVRDHHYIYKLDTKYRESYKKRVLNLIYFIFSKFTDKFLETLVVIAVKNK